MRVGGEQHFLAAVLSSEMICGEFIRQVTQAVSRPTTGDQAVSMPEEIPRSFLPILVDICIQRNRVYFTKLKDLFQPLILINDDPRWIENIECDADCAQRTFRRNCDGVKWRDADQDGLQSSQVQFRKSLGDRFFSSASTGVGLHIHGDSKFCSNSNCMEEQRIIEERFSTGDMNLIGMVPESGCLKSLIYLFSGHPVLPVRAAIIEAVGTGALAAVGEDQAEVGRLQNGYSIHYSIINTFCMFSRN
jgi:hypothetical protein